MICFRDDRDRGARVDVESGIERSQSAGFGLGRGCFARCCAWGGGYCCCAGVFAGGRGYGGDVLSGDAFRGGICSAFAFAACFWGEEVCGDTGGVPEAGWLAFRGVGFEIGVRGRGEEEAADFAAYTARGFEVGFVGCRDGVLYGVDESVLVFKTLP